MSSKKSAQPLNLKIMPSRQLAMFLLLTHAGAMLLVSQLALALPVMLVLTLGIAFSLYSSLRRYVGMRSRLSIVEAVWESDGQWVLLTAHGEAHEADLLPTSIIYSALVLLNFRFQRRQGGISLILPTDSLDRKTFKNLKVRLQLEPPE